MSRRERLNRLRSLREIIACTFYNRASRYRSGIDVFNSIDSIYRDVARKCSRAQFERTAVIDALEASFNKHEAQWAASANDNQVY